MLLAVLNQAQEGGRDNMQAVLEHLVSTFANEDIKYAFELLRDWNTQTKHAYQAQALLNTVLVRHTPKVSNCWNHHNGIGFCFKFPLTCPTSRLC